MPKTRMPLEGRKQFRGRLAGLEEGRVRIDVDGTIVEIPFSSIDKARLEPEF